MPPTAPDPARSKKHGRMLAFTALGLCILFGGFLAVPLALRMFALEAFKMPSGSMRPSLEIDDHIFVEKLVPWKAEFFKNPRGGLEARE